MKSITEYYGNKKKSKEAVLTLKEKKVAKALLERGVRQQDIAYLINIGRNTTINHARISEIEESVKSANDEEIKEFEILKKNWDFNTNLNPYFDEVHLAIYRSRQTMISAIQTFNNPQSILNIEIFITLLNLSWLYLLQAFCLQKGIKYHKEDGSTQALSYLVENNKEILASNILSLPIKHNILSLIKIRDEITHNCLYSLPDELILLLQANVLNYNKILKTLFGANKGLENIFSYALQFAKFSKSQILDGIKSDYSKNIIKIIKDYENTLTSEILENEEFKVSITVAFINKKGGDAIRYISNEDENFGHKKEIILKEIDEDYKYTNRAKDIWSDLVSEFPNYKINQYFFIKYVDEIKNLRNKSKEVSNNKKYVKYIPGPQSWYYTNELRDLIREDIKSGLLEKFKKEE